MERVLRKPARVSRYRGPHRQTHYPHRNSSKTAHGIGIGYIGITFSYLFYSLTMSRRQISSTLQPDRQTGWSDCRDPKDMKKSIGQGDTACLRMSAQHSYNPFHSDVVSVLARFWTLKRAHVGHMRQYSRRESRSVIRQWYDSPGLLPAFFLAHHIVCVCGTLKSHQWWHSRNSAWPHTSMDAHAKIWGAFLFRTLCVPQEGCHL